MKFSIAVYSDPNTSSISTYAFKFARETLDQGHSIYRLFFFNDGVMNCADTNHHTNHAWQSLIESHQLDAIVCMASAQKRGLQQSKFPLESKESGHIHSAFSPGGIAQLVDASVQSDRLVSFGG